MQNGQDIQVPPSLAHLITPSTFFLFNKSDLVSKTPRLPRDNAWIVSLKTGEGTTEFMHGLTTALRASVGYFDSFFVTPLSLQISAPRERRYDEPAYSRH